MTKDEALYQFFKSFGIPAYAENLVPDDAVFPYLTYSLPMGNWYAQETSITANLYYYGTSEKPIALKARELSEKIGKGIGLKCDDGIVWLSPGSPFIQPLKDEVSDSIRRRYINISVRWLTTI